MLSAGGFQVASPEPSEDLLKPPGEGLSSLRWPEPTEKRAPCQCPHWLRRLSPNVSACPSDPSGARRQITDSLLPGLC